MSGRRWRFYGQFVPHTSAFTRPNLHESGWNCKISFPTRGLMLCHLYALLSANKAGMAEVTQKQFRSPIQCHWALTRQRAKNFRFQLSSVLWQWFIAFRKFFLRHTSSLPIQLIWFSIDLRSVLSAVSAMERMAQKSCKQSKFSYRISEQPACW